MPLTFAVPNRSFSLTEKQTDSSLDNVTEEKSLHRARSILTVLERYAEWFVIFFVERCSGKWKFVKEIRLLTQWTTQPVATHSGIAIKPPSTVARHQSLTTSGRLARVEQDTEDKCEDDGADFFFRDQEEGAEVKRVCDNTDRSSRLHVKTTAATSATPTATLEADLTCKKYRSTKGKCKCPS